MASWGDTDTLADAPKYETPSVSFDATAAAVVVLANDKIVEPHHGLETGDRVTYTAGAAPITGLTSGDLYFVIRLDQNEFQLAADAADAAAGTEIALTGLGGGTDTIQVTPDDLFFIDLTEAGVDANRDKGLKTPGWNSYRTYTTGDGRTRHIVEPLVAMKRTAVAAGDAGVTGDTAVEDATVADS